MLDPLIQENSHPDDHTSDRLLILLASKHLLTELFSLFKYYSHLDDRNETPGFKTFRITQDSHLDNHSGQTTDTPGFKTLTNNLQTLLSFSGLDSRAQ